MDSLAKVNKIFVSRELQVEVNKDGIITQVTTNCYDILGYTDDEMLNTNISEYLKYDFDKLVATNNFNTEISRKNGIKLLFDIHVTPLIINNITKSIYLSIIDISKFKELETREKMFFKMLENSKDIVCRLEIIPELKFTYLSPVVEDILGYAVEEYMKNPMLVFEIAHPDDSDIQLSKINSKTDFSKLFELRYRHKDGYYLWLQDYIIPTYNENNQLVAVESITRNINEKKELLQRFERLGYNDSLTGLYNKNYFLKEMNLLNNTINLPIGILVCDLDNLKYINDSLGHSRGDALIKNTGEILKSVFTSEHVISRTGGDEFVIIVKDKSSLEVERLYTELQGAIKTFNEKNDTIPIKISIGLAYSETSISKMESTLDIADSDMYKKKNKRKEK